MSAFWNKKEDDSSDAKDKEIKRVIETKKSVKKSPAKEGKTKEKKAKKSGSKLSAVQAELANRTLVRPRISEDTMNKQAEGKYVFEVTGGATKNEVAKAISAVYGVDVVSVNVMNYKKRSKKFRGHTGRTNAFKKAVVSVKNGQSIELFKEAK